MDHEAIGLEGDGPLSRRTLLRATSVAGLGAIAGCGGVTDQTFTASDPAVDEATVTDLGFTQRSSETIRNSASRDFGPFSGSVTAESKLVVFADDESTPEPSEEERWGESDAGLATWAGNRPVRGVPAASISEDEDIVTTADDLPFESVPTDAAVILYPDDGRDEPVPMAETLVAAPGDRIDWGDRESDGTVTFDEPVFVADVEAVLPKGATLPRVDAGVTESGGG